MFEKIALVFLIISICILLYLMGKIWSRMRRNTPVMGKADTGSFDSLSDIFIVFDKAGTVVQVNPAFRSAFPDFKVLSPMTGIKDMVRYLESKTSRKDPETVFTSLSVSNTPVRNAQIIVTRNGESLTYLMSKDIIVGENAGFIIRMSDISSYRPAAAGISAEVSGSKLAADTSNAKSTFLANMSREIRTPLNAIIGMTEVAKTTENFEDISECMDKINSSAKNLLRIVINALDMSTLESGKFVLYEEPFALSNMIQNIRDLNLTQIKRKNQQFKTVVDKNIPQMILADELRLSQVVNNLLSNAVKFTPDGGHIEFTAELLSRKGQAARLRFAVKDDGIGISENVQSKLFEAFEYTDSSFSRQFGGTGLGLAISQRIVKLMGGVIRVESEAGQGSKFIFEVNCRIPQEQPIGDMKPVESREPAIKVSSNFYGHTILLVEDVEINREIVLALMKDTGVKIDCASNGQTAISMFIANPRKYSMIFMDIQMPILDGYSASQRIRSMDKDIPIIAMTANASADDVQKCKSFGMDDYIAKPVDIDELLKKTEKYIKRKDQR